VYRAVRLNPAALRAVLDRAPQEFTVGAVRAPVEITLPMPDGTFQRFRFVESPVMEPNLAAKFSDIKTYRGWGVDAPAASVRFDWTPAGFHAQILSPGGVVYVDPQWRGDAVAYVSYSRRDCQPEGGAPLCEAFGAPLPAVQFALAPAASPGSIVDLLTYRIAIAATGEYTQFAGGTVPAAMAAIVTTLNRVNGIYETELAMRLVLVDANALIVYPDPNTDPYVDNDGTLMALQNQTNLDLVIGSENYDLGHLFSTGFRALAVTPSACLSEHKAKAVTALPSPVGDPFAVDFVAHEIGHQFGANHTFNGTGSACLRTRVASTAFEPGSGSTIMGYAGLCDPDDLQPRSDSYFHSASLDEIRFYVTVGFGALCGVASATANFAPIVTVGPEVTIPKQTPFALTATGTDPDGDPLTFCWEERDLGPEQALNAPDNGSSPLFRSFPAQASPSRTFPQVTSLLNHAPSPGEQLPSLGRTMNFRVTARDNRPAGGGFAMANLVVHVDDSSGPFALTSPNSAVTWSGVQAVTWDVAGTDGSPVNAARVDVLLSTNGGLDFPLVLLAGTPNDGTATVALPNLSTTQARLKVQASGNVFFDVSDENFTITPSLQRALIELDGAALASENCQPANGAADPGEIVTVQFAVKNVGTANTADLVATLLGAGGVTFPSEPQHFGELVAGGATVARPFTFTATGSCGSSLTAMLRLQDGATDLGTVSHTFTLGAMTSVTRSFTNAGAITIPVGGKASPYPSSISVVGVAGTISQVTVALRGLNHPVPDDLDVVLVAPSGQRVLLMSDVGGITPVSGVTIIFDDRATADMPDFGPILTGTYRPTNIATPDTLPNPAPGPPYSSTLSVFNGLNPNGTWSLYVFDDVNMDDGNLAQGWSLAITAPGGLACCTNTPSADLSVSLLGPAGLLAAGSDFTCTLVVSNAGPAMASPVTLTNQLWGGLIQAAHSSHGSCVNDFTNLICQLGPLTNGASAVVTLIASPASAGQITNRASVHSTLSDPNAANNSASASWTVLPVVRIEATDPAASETGPDAGLLAIIANAATPGGLHVAYALSGSAGNGADYQTLSGSTTIPPDSLFARLSILPVDDAIPEATETAVVTLLPAPDYLIDSGGASAAVTIADNDMPRPEIVAARLSGTDFVIAFTTLSGRMYRMERAANLSAAAWEPVADVPGTGTLVEATDIAGANQPSRFYRVSVLP
jgi:subtilisin-like proprotein convertase family protein